MQNKRPGTLYVVATPIGNLQDITLRALEVLKMVDRIVAEDTRHAAPLLKHFSINKPTLSMHEFNERERVPMIIDCLKKGESIALISDAGTPLINDPGFHLVSQAKAAGIDVSPLPGPNAAIAALSVSGLATDKFTFEGFLPAKAIARANALTTLVHETRTMIFYEAPHRLLATLKSMAEVFGPHRKAVVTRELTKIHETIRMGGLDELVSQFESKAEELRGEVVILVEGVKEREAKKEVVPEEVLNILLEDLPVKQAASLASKITGESKNALYQLALEKKGGKLAK